MEKAKRIHNGHLNLERVEIKDNSPLISMTDIIKMAKEANWEKFKKKFNKHFDYGGISAHREDVLAYIYKELIKK